ncbi:hypothetical protein KFK09_028436 [Dendrobium nobile]|uniref:Bulb-type lectin domain-containing protein n=1 Tax=Dendrobium nobile TaxID=94219 RepID=A0A8T3A337_DENNO|nr:hypothetical protein KFK09_028436 [Dendrobium nobile]
MAFSISWTMIFILSIALFSTQVYADNHLLPDERLNPSNFLKQDRYMLIMQEDCNLILYNLNKPEWATNTANRGSRCFVTLQSDGNFVMYDEHEERNEAIWASNTDGQNGNYVIILQKDGNLVLYSKPIFATGTNRFGSIAVVVAKRNRKAHFGVEQNIIEVTTNL